jgi:hypothetical protein
MRRIVAFLALAVVGPGRRPCVGQISAVIEVGSGQISLKAR